MKDVVVACYIDNQKDIIAEFGWLFKSWLYSGSWLTSDIVAFHHPDVPKDRLPVNNGLRYISVMPTTECDEKWKDYPFINSIGYLAQPEAGVLANYSYVLRTDCDCFLTPYFPTLRPRLTTFGAGQFATEPEVVIKLAEVAKKWNIKPVFNNVGSTMFGRPNQVLMYSAIQLEYCKKLRDEEFLDGTGKWPGWFSGVLSMYAGQLAACSYFGLAMNIGGLDVHCMSHDPISSSDYHIHAWHSYDDFSKFKWRKGEYKERDMAKLDRTKIADYCLWIAGEGPCE